MRKRNYSEMQTDCRAGYALVLQSLQGYICNWSTWFLFGIQFKAKIRLTDGPLYESKFMEINSLLSLDNISANAHLFVEVFAQLYFCFLLLSLCSHTSIGVFTVALM